MSENEGNNPSLERASFPLYHSKKSKTVRVTGRVSEHAQVVSEGANQLEIVSCSGELGSDRERENNRRDVISGVASASSSGDALINPLLSMGFQLPQMALLIQQQQQQKQNLPVPPNHSSVINSLLFPHSLSSVASDKWPAGLPASALQDGVQKGTIMSAAGVYRSAAAVMVAGKDGQGQTSSPAAGKTFGCHLCKDWFFSREKFIMHLVMNHKMLQCRFCSDLFETYDMRETHEAMAHLPLECDACKCVCPSRQELAEHYEVRHDMCTCQFCGVVLNPKSYYNTHARKKHFVTCDDALKNNKLRIVKKWSNENSVWTFVCYLCDKERKKVETFGHFFSYHRCSLVCLLDLLASENMVFSVQGTPSSSSLNLQTIQSEPSVDDSSNNDASHNSVSSTSGNDLHAENPICSTCTIPFSAQVPKSAHEFFCQGLVLCKFCNETFSNELVRKSHISSEHINFSCVVGCPEDIKFKAEADLEEHYQDQHEIKECPYCQALVSTSENKFHDHLKLAHILSDNSFFYNGFEKKHKSNFLFKVVRKGNNLSVVCCLCNSDLTSLARNIINLFKHFHYHRIIVQSAVHLMEIDAEMYVKNTSTDEQNSNVEADDKHTSAWGELVKYIVKHSEQITTVKKVRSPKESQKEDEVVQNKVSSNSQLKGKAKKGNKSSKELEVEESKNDLVDGSQGQTDSPSEMSSDDDSLSGSDLENDHGEFSDCGIVTDLANEPVEAEIDPSEVECVINETSDEEMCDEDDDEDGQGEEESGFLSELHVKQERLDAVLDSLVNDANSQSMSQPLELALEEHMKQIFDSSKTDESSSPAPNGQNWTSSSASLADGEVKQEPQDVLEDTLVLSANEMTTLNKNGKIQGKKFACDICLRNFPVETDLSQHLTTVHNFSVMPFADKNKFKCIESCGKVFISKTSLDVHKMEAHNNAKICTLSFQCPFCTIRSHTKVSIRQHVFSCHSSTFAESPPCKPLAYRCRCCSDEFWKVEDRNQHQLAEHSDTIESFFKCYMCFQSFTSKVCLNRHMRSSHEDQPVYPYVSYKCKLCLVMYPEIPRLRKHFQDSHPAALIYLCRHCNLTLKTKKTLKTHIKNVHSESRRRECSLCGKVLWSKRAYAIHFRMKHSAVSKVGFRCRLCQSKFDSKDERKLHYQLDHEGESPYRCSQCGKGFASKSGMYGHRQLHTGSGESTCGYCGKAFKRKDSYNEHLLIHNGPRHKCPHCPKEFVQRSNLVRHIRIHTGEKPYKCLYCDKCFSDKGACNSHIRVHTGEENCACPFCGQKFSKKQKLKYHVRKHTGEGLINCEICSKSFTNSFALKEHRVIHNRQTQILCRRCGKGFNSEKYLQRHVAIVHEPTQIFNCPLCPKAFSQPGRVKAHIMTHAGVKHMKCLLCDKEYSVRKSLRRHLLEKHDVAPDHPHYKRCFYAMSPEEAGLCIPNDMVASTVSGGSSVSLLLAQARCNDSKVKKTAKKGSYGRRKSDEHLKVVSRRGGRGGRGVRGSRGRPPGSRGSRGGRGGRRKRGQSYYARLSEPASSRDPYDPSASGSGTSRVLRNKPQFKDMFKEISDSEEDDSEDDKSCSSYEYVHQSFRKTVPKKKLFVELQEVEEQKEETPTLLDLVGVEPVKKKRRVEAIVELLQKCSSGPLGEFSSVAKKGEVNCIEHVNNDEIISVNHNVCEESEDELKDNSSGTKETSSKTKIVDKEFSKEQKFGKNKKKEKKQLNEVVLEKESESLSEELEDDEHAESECSVSQSSGNNISVKESQADNYILEVTRSSEEERKRKLERRARGEDVDTKRNETVGTNDLDVHDQEEDDNTPVLARISALIRPTNRTESGKMGCLTYRYQKPSYREEDEDDDEDDDDDDDDDDDEDDEDDEDDDDDDTYGDTGEAVAENGSDKSSIESDSETGV